jgi:SAM-dependent methyltransferase
MGILSRIFRKQHRETIEIPDLNIQYIPSYGDYEKHITEYQRRFDEISLIEQQLIFSSRSEFTVNGVCYVCKKRVDFHVDFRYACKVNGVLTPNWRESLVCPQCGLNNRMRAAIQIFQQECRPAPDSRIYISEQTTPLYSLLTNNYLHVKGSEYRGDSMPYGENKKTGLRNEDLTKLSFKNKEFDYILSFDVLEHVPNYRKALSECFRCLKPDAVFYFSVPFIKDQIKNLVRACINGKGEVNHILPPEYHGDPINPGGCLCFHQFGWELLDELNDIGFKNVNALLYWSRELGYLGGLQVQFIATKNTIECA